MYNIIFHYSYEALVIIGVVLFLLVLFAVMYAFRKRADKINEEIERMENEEDNIAETKAASIDEGTGSSTVDAKKDDKASVDMSNQDGNVLKKTEETEDFASYYEKVVNSEEHKVKGRFNY